MNKKFYFTFLILINFSFFGSKIFADIPSPIPGDGTSSQACDISWNKDVDDKGQTIAETLRHRIELYNSSDLCQFHLFFLFKDQTISIRNPLILENRLHDRGNGIFTGTFIDGYGTKGVSEKLNITIDALKLTEDQTKCAFVVKGGFLAKQQIHGLNIKVQDSSRAICDENGKDLLSPLSSNCPGKQGKECDFKDVTVLVPEIPTPTPTPDPTPKPDPTPTPTPAPKPDPTPVPKEDKSSTSDQSNLSDCQLAQVSHSFSLLAVLPMLLSLVITVSMRAKLFLRS